MPVAKAFVGGTMITGLSTLRSTKASSTRSLCTLSTPQVFHSSLNAEDVVALLNNHQPSIFEHSMSQSNIIKAMESLSFADPRRVPALPLRPSWPAEEATNRRTNALYSAKFLMDTWNLWADCVEKVFQQMGDQTEALEVSDDQYIVFVRMFASHSARPTPRTLEKITEHEEDVMKSMPDRYLAHVHHLWTVYADTLEKTYISMAAELGRCNLLASPFETMSTRGQLHGILRSMMGPGRMFQGLVDRHAPEATTVAETRLQGPSISHIDQMVSGIEHLNLCGAPAMQGGVVDGLVMLLKKISIEAGKS